MAVHLPAAFFSPSGRSGASKLERVVSLGELGFGGLGFKVWGLGFRV